MLPQSASQTSASGRLAQNVLHFARVLRAAGLPIGTDRVLLALQALHIAGIDSRAELHAVLRACLIARAEQQPIFDQAFHVFWTDQSLLGEIMRMLAPSTAATGPVPRAGSRRLADALLPREGPHRPIGPAAEPRAAAVDIGSSDREQLRKRDFESMSAAEFLAAQRCITALRPHLTKLRTRREAPCRHSGRIDLRRMLRHGGRSGGDVLGFPRKVQRRRVEPICVIIDVSGSMSRYSRIFLHFVHALMNAERTGGLRVQAFVFGTRLTAITRQLVHRDADEAIDRVARQVEDWSGGTRIGACLREFNLRWARRFPLSSSTVLLVSDGLEHAHVELLAAECERLARSCRRLIWLNPLLRYDAFEPKARGVRAMLPHVDRMLPVHNLESIEQLIGALDSVSQEFPGWR